MRLRPLSVALAVLAIALIALPATVQAQKKGGGGTTPPADPAIVIAAVVSNERRLVVMNTDGSNATVLSTSPIHSAPSASPSFSPDGRSIAFVAGAGINIVDIAIVNGVPKAINERVLVPNQTTNGYFYPRYPRWSPGGHEIAFWTENQVVGGDIYLVPATGGTPSLIYSGPAAHMCWSPDGLTIAATGMDSWDAFGQVFLIDRMTGESVSWQVAVFGGFVSIDWARNSGKLALGLRGGPDDAIDTMLMDAVPGAQPDRLFANGFKAVWSPADTQIAYTKLIRNTWTLVRRDLATGTEVKLFKPAYGVDWRRF